MNINLTMSSNDIKKIFAKYEGGLIHDENKMLLFSSRSMLGGLFIQLPYELRNEIKKKYPRVIAAIRLGRNINT